MTKSNVKPLERQLGYDVEPALSNGHECLQRIKTATNSLKRDYVDTKPRALRNDQEFRRRCETIFHRYGPRIWNTTHTRPTGSGQQTVDYPKPLLYSLLEDRGRLSELFHNLCLEKCRVRRQSMLDKKSRARRETHAAAALFAPQATSMTVTKRDGSRSQHAAASEDVAHSSQREEAAIPGQAPNIAEAPPSASQPRANPNESDSDFIDDEDDVQTESEDSDSECCPHGTLVSLRRNRGYEYSPVASTAQQKRSMRGGYGGAQTDLATPIGDEEPQNFDAQHASARDEARDEPLHSAAADDYRLLSPPHAGNTLKRRGKSLQNPNSSKRPRPAHPETPAGPVAAPPGPSNHGAKMYDQHEKGNEDAQEPSVPTFRLPSVLFSSFDDGNHRAPTAIMVEAEDEYESCGAAQNDCEILASHVAYDPDADADDDGGDEPVVYSPSDPDVDVPQRLATNKGKEPIRSALAQEQLQSLYTCRPDGPIASSTRPTTAETLAPDHGEPLRVTQALEHPAALLNADSGKFMLVDWKYKDDESTTVCRLMRYEQDLWSVLKKNMPPSFQGKQFASIKRGTMRMSATDALESYGSDESIGSNGLEDCMEFLVNAAFGEEADVERVWWKATVKMKG